MTIIELERAGTSPGDADLQIAATALRHDLVLVTGNLRHYERVPELRIERILTQARAARGWCPPPAPQRVAARATARAAPVRLWGSLTGTLPLGTTTFTATGAADAFVGGLA